MIEYRVGDVFARLAEIPDGSIDLVLTSPPFLALRSYLPADHPDKGLEIGSEPDPATFIDTMLRLTTEWRRVLAPHGSICIELGDTYPEYGGGDAWPIRKSICGIPWLYTLSLAYGRNLLNPEHRIERWRVRNVVAWCRPNPPVGVLGDKFRPATSYLTIACMSKQRYFDIDAVRVPLKVPEAATIEGAKMNRAVANHANDPRSRLRGSGGASTTKPMMSNEAGAPPLDHWEIPTQGYKGSHYATWPEALLERPILSMVPRTVCLTCGEPSRRIAEATHYKEYNANRRAVSGVGNDSRKDSGASGFQPAHQETIGWTDCGHDNNRIGIVLDPFGGSGTTGVVAQGHGRDAILIDIDERNAELARDRVGMFLTVTT